MKKGIIVLFILSMFLPSLADATYHLNWFIVQNRLFEDGTHKNRLSFQCVNSNDAYPSTDVMDSVVLTDPEGHNVVVNVIFESYLQGDASYNASTSQWVYPSSPYQYGGYYANFSDQVVTGKYHLKFIDKDGEISEMDYVVNKIVDLPIIPTSSYNLYFDQSGNLIWRWQVPDYIDPSLQTNARASISVYDEQRKVIGNIDISKIPTQMGFVFVPKAVVDYLMSVGNIFHLGTMIRTIDNNNRSYSTGIGN